MDRVVVEDQPSRGGYAYGRFVLVEIDQIDAQVFSLVSFLRSCVDRIIGNLVEALTTHYVHRQ